MQKYNSVFSPKAQQQKIDQAIFESKIRLFPDSIYSTQLYQISPYQPSQQDLNPDQITTCRKTPLETRQEVKKRYRRANSLKEQHHIKPFTHKIDLLFEDNFDEKTFRRKLTRYNQDRFHIVWQIEQCYSQKHNHFHAILRTDCEIKEFESYLKDCISHRKGQTPKIKYKLNIDLIDDNLFDSLAEYNSKSSARLLKKIVPQAKGKRTIFTTGKPYSKPARQLHKQHWEVTRHSLNPDLIEVESYEEQLLQINQDHVDELVSGIVVCFEDQLKNLKTESQSINTIWRQDFQDRVQRVPNSDATVRLQRDDPLSVNEGTIPSGLNYQNSTGRTTHSVNTALKRSTKTTTAKGRLPLTTQTTLHRGRQGQPTTSKRD